MNEAHEDETKDNVPGLSNQVSDSLFDENELDVIDNEDFDCDILEEDGLNSVMKRKLRKLRNEKDQEDGVVEKYSFLCRTVLWFM